MNSDNYKKSSSHTSPKSKYVDGTKTIYLDHAATTPLDREVYAAMRPYFSAAYGNPSSLHKSGRRSAAAIEDAREEVARLLGAESDEIIFTGSGTESDNLAVVGAARANRTHGTRVIISAIEHKAVLEAAHELEKDGFVVDMAPVDRFGMIDVSDIVSRVDDNTTLVSVMAANNEIGTTQPIAELASALRKRREKTGYPLIHTDACQMAGSAQLDVSALGVDLLTLNSSKLYGPKGVGVLYKKRHVMIAPLIVGGGQERGLRAGTESVPQIVGMAAAFEKAVRIREEEVPRMTSLRNRLISGLRTRVPDILINGHPEHTLPHIAHVTVPSVEGESMVLMLDEKGIEAATGSACSASDLRPSHVMVAVGQSDELIHGSVRFSLGRTTTKGDIDYVLSVFPEIVERLKSASALTTHQYEKVTAKTATL